MSADVVWFVPDHGSHFIVVPYVTDAIAGGGGGGALAGGHLITADARDVRGVSKLTHVREITKGFEP